MKNYSLAGLLIVVMNISLHAAFNADSVFKEANTAFINNDFNKAVLDYENILDHQYTSAVLYYNLGNSYYKLGLYPKAILYYEKSLLLDPRNENCKFNLAKAKIYNVDKIDEIPQFVIKRWWTSVVTLLSSNVWSILSISFFFLGVLGIMIYFLTIRIGLRRSGFFIGLFLIAISAGTFGLANQSRKLILENNSAIIMSPAVIIKGSPSATGTDLFILHEGTKVFILDELDNWFEIRISDGKQGWMGKADVEII